MKDGTMKSVIVRPVASGDWDDILAIQRAAYGDGLLESGAVLRSKAAAGPETSLLAVEAAGKIAGESAGASAGGAAPGQALAYLLAHPWPLDDWPPLGSLTPPCIKSANLQLHDLAVHPRAKGRGLARRLLAHLLEAARAGGYRTVSLVAVQGAAGFWQRQGFTPVGPAPAEKGYDAGAMLMRRTV